MFPTSEAPRFQRSHGFVFGIVWVTVMVIWLSAVMPLIERHFTKRSRHRIDEDSAREIDPSGTTLAE